MSDVYPLFREAEVISTKDPKELGRIQLKVFPELADVPEGDLPWCFPMASGPHDGDFSTPLEKQWVYCTVWNKYWSEISFLPWCMPDPKKPKFKDFKDDLIPEVTDYKGIPDVQHTVGSILEDGFVTFHDTKESQHGILHPSGTYVMINKDGEVFIKSVKKLTFHNKDDTVWATVDSESGDIELKTKGSVAETIDGNIVLHTKGNVTRTVEGSVTETVNKEAKYQSDDTDIVSVKPVGINGGKNNLGSACLRPYWEQEKMGLEAYDAIAVAPVPVLLWLARKPEVIMQKLNDTTTVKKSDLIIK
jgi:hypothetical protein